MHVAIISYLFFFECFISICELLWKICDVDDIFSNVLKLRKHQNNDVMLCVVIKIHFEQQIFVICISDMIKKYSRKMNGNETSCIFNKMTNYDLMRIPQSSSNGKHNAMTSKLKMIWNIILNSLLSLWNTAKDIKKNVMIKKNYFSITPVQIHLIISPTTKLFVCDHIKINEIPLQIWFDLI